MRRQYLDCDGAVEAGVAGAIHFAIPPAPTGLTISYGPSLVPEESDTVPPRECSNCMRGQEIVEAMVCVTLTTSKRKFTFTRCRL